MNKTMDGRYSQVFGYNFIVKGNSAACGRFIQEIKDWYQSAKGNVGSLWPVGYGRYEIHGEIMNYWRQSIRNR